MRGKLSILFTKLLSALPGFTRMQVHCVVRGYIYIYIDVKQYHFIASYELICTYPGIARTMMG